MIWISSAVLIFAGTNSSSNTTKDKIQKFLTTSIKPNKNVKVLKFKIAKVVSLKDIQGWKAYILTIDLKLLKQNNRVITIKDVLFSNGKYLSRSFIDLKTKKKLKDSLLRNFVPDANSSYYDKEHLLFGSSNAKYKVMVFSDPQCPFCIDFVPGLMKFIKKHPKAFALYYYHLPLSIHPTSATIVKAEIAAENKGYKGIAQKVYSTDFETKTNDAKTVLAKFNKELKTNITLDDIKSKSVLKRYNEDLQRANKLMINGTPTIFVNGKYDAGREIIGKLMKEYK
jgi:predicted DsbA family dithiol-disulfide isomerase